MDVNGTRYHLLLGEADWLRNARPIQPPSALAFDQCRNELTLTPLPFRSFPASRIDAAFMPRPLRIVENLPRNATGKLPRAALQTLAAETLLEEQ